MGGCRLKLPLTGSNATACQALMTPPWYLAGAMAISMAEASITIVFAFQPVSVFCIPDMQGIAAGLYEAMPKGFILLH